MKLTGTLIAAVLIVFFIKKSGSELSWVEVSTAADRIGWGTALIALFFVCLQTGCQILRLWWLLPENGVLTLGRVSYVFSVGQFLNSFVPARAGDVVKMMMLAKGGGPAVGHNAGVMVADKLVDLLSLVLLVVFAGSMQFIGLAILRERGLAMGVPLAVFFAVLGGGILFRRGIVARFPVMSRFEAGMRCLVRPRHSLPSICWSVGSWALEAIAVILLTNKLGLALSFSQAVYCLFLLNAAIAIPVSVANVGTFEASLIIGLTQFGLGLSESVAVAGIHHLLQWTGISIWAGGTTLIQWLDKQSNSRSQHSRKAR